MENKKVCIIGGGGAAGLCAARQLQAVNKAGCGNFETTLYEKSDSVGGTWIYAEPPTIGNIDQKMVHREWDVHSSMYDVLLTNLPKEIMGFQDFSFDKIIPKDSNSFISRENVLTYLEEYAKPVLHLIKFNSLVLNVESLKSSNADSSDQWKVTVSQKAGDSSKTFSQVFDCVFVCTGHFTVPRLPPFLSKVKLPAIHSHYYRKATLYAGQTVCVIGASFSGMDICLQVAEYAHKVYLSHRKPSENNTTFGVLPANCIEVGLVLDASATTLTLANGDELKDLDAVISCTGYKYSYPFFKDVVNTPADGGYVSPLLAHCAHRDHLHSLFFIGLTSWLVPFMAIEHQVLFATAMMLHLVDQEELRPDKINEYEAKRIKELEASGKLLRHFHQLGTDQWDYYHQLYEMSTANDILPRFKKIPIVQQRIYEHVNDQRKLSVQHYKKFNYKILDDENFEVYC